MCAEVYDKLPVSAEVKDLFRYVNGFVGCFHDLAFVFFTLVQCLPCGVLSRFSTKVPKY